MSASSLQSWEQLSATLYDLFKAVGVLAYGGSPLTRGLRELEEREVAARGLAPAVRELQVLRNAVAHGQHNLTASEAVAYASAAQELRQLALSLKDALTDLR